MSIETDYIKLCKSLCKDSPCILCQTDNKYVCAHTLVKRYVNNDLNKLKKLKAESMSIGLFNEDYEHSISLCALVFSTFVLFMNIVKMDPFKQNFVKESFIVILLAFINVIRKYILMKRTIEYHNYTDIAIEDLEKELTSL